MMINDMKRLQENKKWLLPPLRVELRVFLEIGAALLHMGTGIMSSREDEEDEEGQWVLREKLTIIIDCK